MAYLLDTHALLFYLLGNHSLSTQVVGLIEGQSNIYVSAISLMEIALKSSLGKLELVDGFDALEKWLESNNFKQIQITFEDLTSFHNLSWHHRDPFDRMLIAQAISRNMTLVTKDQFIHQYPVKTLW